MCFRPAQIEMKNCSKCGTANKPVATVCESCGAELETVVGDFDADQAALDAAIKMPGAPAPSAPGAPAAPKAPGAPKASGAPKPPTSN